MRRHTQATGRSHDPPMKGCTMDTPGGSSNHPRGRSRKSRADEPSALAATIALLSTRLDAFDESVTGFDRRLRQSKSDCGSPRRRRLWPRQPHRRCQRHRPRCLSPRRNPRKLHPRRRPAARKGSCPACARSSMASRFGARRFSPFRRRRPQNRSSPDLDPPYRWPTWNVPSAGAGWPGRADWRCSSVRSSSSAWLSAGVGSAQRCALENVNEADSAARTAAIRR
jgi:hypothetical protein